ncbi:MAG: hypothetical protein KAS96_00920 [Planctomycetes bacterium]|nr:hypothetical protein [Planctomycetota bacterium]
MIIEFQCPHCGKKIKINEKYIGKKGECPGCKGVITIPGNKINDAFLNFLEDDSPLKTKLSTENLDPVQTRSNQHNQAIIEQQQMSDEKDIKKQHGLLDILLYPTSLAGIVNLVFFTALPLIAFLANSILGPLAIGVNLVIIAAGLYYYWYLTECIRDSASGKTRAPVLSVQLVDFKDVFFSYLTILACGIFFIGPAIVYANYFKRFDYIFWLLVLYGLIFSPIALLGVVLYDSVSVFNPFFLIGSIISTFINYCRLLLILIFIVVLIWLVNFTSPFLMGLPAKFLQMYLTMVAAHFIGFFFWKNEAKLRWEV